MPLPKPHAPDATYPPSTRKARPFGRKDATPTGRRSPTNTSPNPSAGNRAAIKAIEAARVTPAAHAPAAGQLVFGQVPGHAQFTDQEKVTYGLTVLYLVCEYFLCFWHLLA